MTDGPVELDEHRGMAAQKATEIRRRLHEVHADQEALRLGQRAHKGAKSRLDGGFGPFIWEYRIKACGLAAADRRRRIVRPARSPISAGMSGAASYAEPPDCAWQWRPCRRVVTIGGAGRRWDMRWRGIAVAIIVIVACLIALGLASDFLVDWLLFSTVGYFDVFWTIFGAKAILFFAVFAVLDRGPVDQRNAGVPGRPAARAL